MNKKICSYDLEIIEVFQLVLSCLESRPFVDVLPRSQEFFVSSTHNTTKYVSLYINMESAASLQGCVSGLSSSLSMVSRSFIF